MDRWFFISRTIKGAFPGLWAVLRQLRRSLLDCLSLVLSVISLNHPRFSYPRRAYSLLAKLRAGEVPGRVVLESQPIPVLRPDSLRTISPLNQKGEQPWPIFWATLEQVRLVGPHLVPLDHEGRFAAEANGFQYHRMVLLNHYWKLPAAEHLSGDWTSIAHPQAPNYYHWLLDCLPRLTLLRELPAGTRILYTQGGAFQREILRMLGLEDRAHPARQHYLVERYHFSAPTEWQGLYDPYAVRYLRSALLHHADRDYPASPRIYLRRRNLTRVLANEEELVEQLTARGWKAIDPGELTVAQQIKVFSKAEAICGLHGAAMANLLWCRPGCKVLEIIQRTHMNGCYENIAEANQLDYRYLLSDADAHGRSEVSPKSILDQIGTW